MSYQVEAELKVEAMLTLSKLLNLDIGNQDVRDSLKWLNKDIIEYYNLKRGESVVVTINNREVKIERTESDKLAIC
jgi:hypothetical protein